MKKLLLSSLVVFGALVSSFAQFGTCVPDEVYADSALGVYPAPFDMTLNPFGGITDSACFNKNYQFVFTAVVGDTIKFGGVPYVLDSIRITGVTGLPAGFDYNCNNSTCTFKQNELGCAVIFGKATNAADIGQHELFISATVYTGGLPLQLTFPNPLIAPGHFYLYILDENSTNCVVYASLFEVASQFESVRNMPNPFSGTTTIEVESREAGPYQFQVSDMLGRVVYSRSVQIAEGINQIDFDGSQLPDGIYLYSFFNGVSQVTNKMQISRW
ncbi:MAG: T9SS type A sorting domain-containing protein [Lewinellaceae bacterium]|nr:T9SS type A sorting domain-containing protein [Lewinellaceae bacterium]